MKVLGLLLIIISATYVSAADILRPFSSDLCTGYSEGTKTKPHLWESCCIKHDLFLWAGGTHQQRLKVDAGLRSCVKATGQSMHSYLIWLGVRAGSFSPIKIKGKQWGNAWSEKTRGQALSLEEIEMLQESLLNHSEMSIEAIEEFASELRIRNSVL